ncbi:serine/threonine protein kinase [Dulcicalothrix desertica PCC 7102]|uniref:histidine kinase n=1 Tax=Dulcicalothrix desertica PCC 7102 TaxID=232991 RepID=A0A3S1CTV0_9CYAN|nr:ATP-binding sensor histidine kinase [Dulcicalothrix desertica]RUT09210.1 serine/threonine protein kinase [Dulcicalothrix desertica PCC 7102]TWH55037.1 putative ATPase [Dulcicalothrix desertica PCC 7102]
MAILEGSIPGYHLSKLLYDGSRTLVYRGQRLIDQKPVVIKLLKNSYPNFNELVQFRNQYTIAENLDIPGIIRPYSLEPYQNAYALVMEDFGGVSLRDYVRTNTLGLWQLVTVAIQVADILDGLKKARVIHKDIKPANILIHPHSQQIKLIDFSIASLLPRETQEIHSHNLLEGTLAYLAPEQTGRMNRGIDYRTDFYSLGITLYELFTGKLPFGIDDPMELVHCHIAKYPPLVHEINPEIPPVLSLIVEKLMAKNAEDRYQSALGLKYDLERCLYELKDTHKIESFEIAQRDISDRFLIPEKLYGREAEVKMLLDAFERVAGNPLQTDETHTIRKSAAELILVAGFSGIGKTAVVNEVHKPIVRQCGYFIKGKFDQFQRNIPLFAFVQAFRDLMGQLLSQTDVKLQQWKAKILQALGESAQVIVEVIPELEYIIGKQPVVAELSGSAAQNRFNLLFQKFIQVFTTIDHPLVIFIDDLQWADSASLRLMQLLLSEAEAGYLLLIGAYRDNEVFAAHPLILTLEELQKNNVTLNTITLAPLKEIHLNQLIADTLSCTTKIASPLTQLVYHKTKGNPFFSNQFLKALHDDGLITFNSCERQVGWQCDIAQVQAKAVTDDVVEFMALQLQKLPLQTQNVLKLAACIGNQFDLATLAIIYEKSQVETAEDLWKALQEGLILPTTEVYKFFQDGGNEKTTQLSTICYQLPNYKFLHDRVQQAAYYLIPEAQKQATHLKIGQMMKSNSEEVEREDILFAIVNQLNIGAALITQQENLEELAQLNLLAGRKARAATAYEPAWYYAITGIQLLGDSWQEAYDLTLALYDLGAETAYLCGNYEQIELLSNVVLEQAKTLLDKVKAYEVKIFTYVAQKKPLEAIEIGLQVLKLLEITFPQKPTGEDIGKAIAYTASLIPENGIEDLIHLPEMTDASKIAALSILKSISSSAYIANPPLHLLILLSMVNLSIQYGNDSLSTIAYSAYGTILCGVVQDIECGGKFGKLALKLLQKYNNQEKNAQTFMLVATFTMHWQTHVKETLSLLQLGYQNSIEAGDLQHAAWNLFFESQYSCFIGHELNQLTEKMANYSTAFNHLKQELHFNYHQIFRQFVLNLTGSSETPFILVGEAYNESKLLAQHQQANDTTALYYFHLNKLILCYLFEELSQAVTNATIAETYLETATATLLVPIFNFYNSLARLGVYHYCSTIEQKSLMEKVELNQEKMKKWATHAPMNHQHKYELVEAERYRLLNNKVEAIELYDKAIAGARANEYLSEEALANELAGKFYLEWGREKIATTYMQEAYYCYARWGAKAKISDLEERYPQLLQPILQQKQLRLNSLETISSITTARTVNSTQTSTSSSTSISSVLDFATILKASQTLSGEIHLDKLLTCLLNTIITNAGASKCVLMLLWDNDLRLEAIAIKGQEPIILQASSIEHSSDVPVSLIYTVKRSLQTVVINNATKEDSLLADSYIIQQQSKSLLCTPILNQGKLLGILYLENNLVIGAFTKERVEILNLLCTQAAISLENARLYQKSQNYAQQLEDSLASLQEKARLTAFRADVDTILTQENSLQVTLQRCTEVIVQHLDAAFARIWTLNSVQQILELRASAGIYTHINGSHSQIPVGQFKIGLIAFERKPHLTNQVLEDSRISNREWAKREGMVAFAGYPLIVDGQIVGVLAMFARQILSESVLESLEFAASEIALGIKRKLSEEALLQSETQLRQKTTELENVLHQLQQTQTQLVQNEKMSSLGNLVAGVAHEVNNPIGFLRGSLNNAQEYVKDLLEYIQCVQQHHTQLAPAVNDFAEEVDLEFLAEDLPKLITSMKGATARIQDISTSLRTFSRADTAEKVACNIHEGIDSTLLILKYRLKANEFRPAIEVIKAYDKLPPVKCFLGQLNQVFMNILANAIDAIDEQPQKYSFDELKANPKQITITTEVLQAYNTAVIRIKDNGSGMSESVKAKIFDHLFTTKGVGKGTGLGLAIAHQIVEETHAGKLICNSAPNIGTEFVIELPLG